jgi:hypothetical protein
MLVLTLVTLIQRSLCVSKVHKRVHYAFNGRGPHPCMITLESSRKSRYLGKVGPKLNLVSFAGNQWKTAGAEGTDSVFWIVYLHESEQVKVLCLVLGRSSGIVHLYHQRHRYLDIIPPYEVIFSSARRLAQSPEEYP